MEIEVTYLGGTVQSRAPFIPLCFHMKREQDVIAFTLLRSFSKTELFEDMFMKMRGFLNWCVLKTFSV